MSKIIKFDDIKNDDQYYIRYFKSKVKETKSVVKALTETNKLMKDFSEDDFAEKGEALLNFMGYFMEEYTDNVAVMEAVEKAFEYPLDIFQYAIVYDTAISLYDAEYELDILRDDVKKQLLEISNYISEIPYEKTVIITTQEDVDDYEDDEAVTPYMCYLGETSKEDIDLVKANVLSMLIYVFKDNGIITITYEADDVLYSEIFQFMDHDLYIPTKKECQIILDGTDATYKKPAFKRYMKNYMAM